MKSIEPYVSNTTYIHYQQGKTKIAIAFFFFLHLYNQHEGKARAKNPVPSVAFINFKDQMLAESFFSVYNNHPFIDSKGKEDRAQVEWAVYQRVPKPRRRADPRAGTIEQGV